MCTVGGRIGWIVTRSGTARRPGIPGTTTSSRDYSAESSSESSSSESEKEIVEDPPVPNAERAAERAANAAARPACVVARATRNERRRKAAECSRTKFKEDDYIQRKRDLQTQRKNERTMYPMMWKRMSLASQSRVKEEEEFKTAYLTLDCVLLWTLIRKTHLTHMFGDEDPMQEFNQQEQESKYGLLSQGEREFITTFKARFDEQVAANLAVGIAPVSDSKRAPDFLGKLDPRRYKKMHFQMKNDTLHRKPEAFPTSIASAFCIASQWYNDDRRLRESVRLTGEGSRSHRHLHSQPTSPSEYRLLHLCNSEDTVTCDGPAR